MRIIENIVNNGHGALNPQYLFIHETSNPGATALNHVHYWRNSAYAVHYVCDWTGNVYHCVPDNRKCWQVGNGNGYGVGIEICHAKNQADFNNAYATAVEFAAYYLKKKGWNISHMMSHHQAAKRWGGSTHTDPDDYFAQFGKSWNQFVSDVSAKMGSGTTSAPAPTAPSQNVANTTGALKVQVLINDLYIRPTPGSSQHKGFTGKGVFTITQVQNNWGKLKSGMGWIYIGNPSYTKILGGAAPTAPAPAPSTLKVQVLINDLCIRPTPGSKQRKGFTGKGVFTITQVQNNWGKLKSGAGWIYIGNPSYTKILGGAAPTTPAPAPAPARVNTNTKTDSAQSFSRSIARTYTTTANLRLRSGASTSKAIITVIPKGAKVNCYGYHTGGWYYVQYGNHTGFCSKDYLR